MAKDIQKCSGSHGTTTLALCLAPMTSLSRLRNLFVDVTCCTVPITDRTTLVVAVCCLYDYTPRGWRRIIANSHADLDSRCH